MATYGWIERNDTQAIVDALDSSEHPDHLFAFGESMGAGIALQSAAIDSRIEAVVAEASFASLREASYDYAGLRWSPLLGRTLFVPYQLGASLSWRVPGPFFSEGCLPRRCCRDASVFRTSNLR